ncbi:erythrocyte membrane protein 1, PfEMP1, putative [Plasmodium reichenowi]|uniref:Erythrocyte membrane protein 1, PfEMP1, putative n=1 Tax=Plasmodium reichenowi TaxID=5854 RepID=A0A2P9DT67_PLARE|nr:erythrocyte membrane protein 1, PfEMP1, putative [Plasmodium reichenowi]
MIMIGIHHLFKDNKKTNMAKRLKRVIDDNDKLLQAMKYSFSDIGNVVKGDDMMEKVRHTEYMDKIFKGRKYTGIDRKKLVE